MVLVLHVPYITYLCVFYLTMTDAESKHRDVMF